MKVNLSIEVTDEQRNALAALIANKPTKALAKRDDVRDFVEGCLATLRQTETAAPQPPTPAAHTTAHSFWNLLTPKELELANKMKQDGRPDGFIRGYFFIERAERRHIKPAGQNATKRRRPNDTTEDV